NELKLSTQTQPILYHPIYIPGPHDQTLQPNLEMRYMTTLSLDYIVALGDNSCLPLVALAKKITFLIILTFYYIVICTGCR
ncbi:26960_t:CDS:2, partial [Dentiscutata erythropus]